MPDDHADDRETGIRIKMIKDWTPEPFGPPTVEQDIALQNLLRRMKGLPPLPVRITSENDPR